MLIAGAHTQQGVGRDVGLEHAVEHRDVVFVQVLVGLAPFVFGDHASAQRPSGIEPGTQVCGDFPIVPAADAGIEIALELRAVRMLAHQIDRGRRIAGAGKQTGRAADDLDAIVERHVDDRLSRVAGQTPGQRHAVDLIVGDLKASGIEGIAHIIDFIRGHTHRIDDHVGHRGQILISDSLRRDHADRLRRFARRQAEPGRHVDLVAGDIAAGDDHLRQLDVLAPGHDGRFRIGCRSCDRDVRVSCECEHGSPAPPNEHGQNGKLGA